MNLSELQTKLTAAARLQPDDERVPYAYEKRISALIEARAMMDRRAMWARGLWRAAVACVILAAICGALSWFAPAAPVNGQDLSQDFANTLLATMDQGDASSMP